jgi:hypothetical protein
MDAGDALPADIEEEILDCSQVASELKHLFAKAENASANLPRYSALVPE